MINRRRLKFALDRRGFTRTELAKALEVTPRTINNYIKKPISPDVLQKLGRILKFSPAFFEDMGELPLLNDFQVSFRAQSRISNRLKNQAKSFGVIAFMLNDWVEKRFELNKADLPDLSQFNPEDAAQILRSKWGLGIHPIANMVELLESKGVRVFSLAIDALEVDAFCTWNEHTPFVFLNTMKSAERSRFDCAHELGHLVRDVYNMKHNSNLTDETVSDFLSEEGLSDKRPIEKEANDFASAFLMPKDALLPIRKQSITNIEQLIELKKVFGVSVAAIAYRLYKLEIISDWIYTRVLCPKIAISGFRKTEPQPMRRDESNVWQQLFNYFEEDKISIDDIANELNIDFKDIADLTFGLVSNKPHSMYHLKLIK